MDREDEMSCPCLEKGRMAYCHAFGNEKLGVDSSELLEVCFSGEFSECAFLSLRLLNESEKNKREGNHGQRSFEGPRFG
jgi:hypothetical protein